MDLHQHIQYLRDVYRHLLPMESADCGRYLGNPLKPPRRGREGRQHPADGPVVGRHTHTHRRVAQHNLCLPEGVLKGTWADLSLQALRLTLPVDTVLLLDQFLQRHVARSSYVCVLPFDGVGKFRARDVFHHQHLPCAEVFERPGNNHLPPPHRQHVVGDLIQVLGLSTVVELCHELLLHLFEEGQVVGLHEPAEVLGSLDVDAEHPLSIGELHLDHNRGTVKQFRLMDLADRR
mmetsp:Transcript_5345/g.14734  ORF Transcript_5345/g.14734 Transcript_5345/m.14734 type:complete len:234 (-) Transcript_5345:539-1240(-)